MSFSEPYRFQDRPYQDEALEAVYSEFGNGIGSTLVCMPTGTGKTVVAAKVASRAVRDHGHRVLFLAERRHLVGQAKRTISRAGLRVAVEMGILNAKLDPKAQVILATPQTMRGDRLQSWQPRSFGTIITDECQHSRAPSYKSIYDRFVDYKHLGITATPGRGDGKNLGAVFQSTAYRLRFQDAVKSGYIVPVDPQVIKIQVDLRKIKMTKSDMNVGDLAERIGPHVERLCDAVRREIGDRHTLIFTPDVASAMAVSNALNQMGVTSRYVAGQAGTFGMKKAECLQHLKSYDRCDFQVLVCCELLKEGYDCSHIECVVIMRPTLNRFLYTQMIGRGTRPCEEIGKTNCLVLDFDWLCDPDARDYVSPVELFDDGDEDLSPEVKTIARERIRSGESDFMTAIEDAKKIVRDRPQIKIVLTGAKANYEKFGRDPMGVARLLDVQMKPWFDMDRYGRNPASKGQLDYLVDLGVKTPKGVSKWGASKLINNLKLRQKLGLATIDQVQELLAGGVMEDRARTMSYDEAFEILGK